jgi:hypothetical protein
MKGVVNLYGKTWHFWQVDKGDELPLGKYLQSEVCLVLVSSGLTVIYETRLPCLDGITDP